MHVYKKCYQVHKRKCEMSCEPVCVCKIEHVYVGKNYSKNICKTSELHENLQFLSAVGIANKTCVYV